MVRSGSSTLVSRWRVAAAAALAFALQGGLGVVWGQAADANSQRQRTHELIRFDVVSIKPTPSSDDKTRIELSPDGNSFHGAPVRMVLRTAFGVEDDRIVGAPSWVNTSRYDIEAKVAPEDAPGLEKLKGDERNAMLISVLTERFHLKYHHAARELPMYALEVAKGGPKLTKGEPEPPGGYKPPDPDHPVDPAKEHYKIMTVPGHIEADSVPMSVLADVLTQLHVGRIVVDKTGLTDNYNFALKWTPELPAWLKANLASGGLGPADDVKDDVPSSLFTALQEQLGLKLVPEKSSVDVIVIDHIEPPSPN